jgi:hypothetical protein
MRRVWRRGATSLAMTWFMLFAVLLALGLDSLFGVYAGLQRGRTAVRAAAGALVAAVHQRLPAAVESEVAARVARIKADPGAQAEIEAGLRDLAEMQERCRLDPLCVPLDEESLAAARLSIRAAAYRAAFARLYAGTISDETARLVADGGWADLDSIEKRNRLIPDETDLGCLLTAVTRAHWDEVRAAADDLARANGAQLDWAATETDVPGARNWVVVQQPVYPFGAEWLYEAGFQPRLRVGLGMRLESVGSRHPIYTPSC